jgi:hypothetical protein
MALYQICFDCGSQQNIEPYDICQTCGHEWSSGEIMSSTPVPRPTTGAMNLEDSAPSQALSQPEVNPVGQGESTNAVFSQ